MGQSGLGWGRGRLGEGGAAGGEGGAAALAARACALRLGRRQWNLGTPLLQRWPLSCERPAHHPPPPRHPPSPSPSPRLLSLDTSIFTSLLLLSTCLHRLCCVIYLIIFFLRYCLSPPLPSIIPPRAGFVPAVSTVCCGERTSSRFIAGAPRVSPLGDAGW